MKTLLRKIRKSTSYAYRHKWEPGIDSDNHPNSPFKPAFIRVDGCPNDDKQADAWGGDLGDWEDALKRACVGHTIDFYVTSLVADELVTNVHVWLVSETEAWVQDCGCKPYRVTITPALARAALARAALARAALARAALARAALAR